MLMLSNIASAIWLILCLIAFLYVVKVLVDLTRSFEKVEQKVSKIGFNRFEEYFELKADINSLKKRMDLYEKRIERDKFHVSHSSILNKTYPVAVITEDERQKILDK